MAKGYSNFKLEVEEFTLNGAKCKCPIIKIVALGSDIAPGCCYDEKTMSISGQIKDNPDAKDGSNCITFQVRCSEKDCVGVKTIVRCLCTDKTQCADCNECVKGICTPTCPEERCFEGACLDCNEDKHCTCNKKCRNGRCTCDPGLIDNGTCCVECNEDNPCGPCFDCIGGKCILKDCGKGQCNFTTGECSECTDNSACGPNECCVNNECKCCSGYTKDSCTGHCVQLPQRACTVDSNCGSCSECQNIDPCTGYGSCNPTKCPSNTVCVPGKGCLPLCSCSDRSCSGQGGTNSCADHPTLPNVCYCTDCSQGNCPQAGGCGPSNDKDACICNGEVCEPNPCNGQTCSSAFDCGLGCTCLNGSCVPCSQFDCTITGSGSCNGAKRCGCSNGECVGDANATCSDQLTISKDLDTCSLVGLWQSTQGCKCPDITVEITPTLSGGNISLDYQLFKGDDAISGRELSNNSNDDIADTEEPTSGGFSYSIIDDIRIQTFEETESGRTLLTDRTDVETTTAANASYNVNDLITNTSEYSALNSVDSVNNNGVITETTVIGQKIEIRLHSSLVFNQSDGTGGGTGCTYGKRGDIVLTLTPDQLGQAHSVTLRSASTRPPLFKWAMDGEIFRKVYVKKPYRDVVGYDEGLRACKNVDLDVDCGCQQPAVSDSEFCNPNPADVKVEPTDACRKEFKVTVPAGCKLNQYGTILEIDFGVAGTGFPSGSTTSGTATAIAITDSIQIFTVSLPSPATEVSVDLKCCS